MRKEASEIVESIVNNMCNCDKPFFITGTKLATNAEWTIASNDLNEKLPLIWLLEVIDEVGYGEEHILEREMNVRLFFLDETDPSQYYTKEHREKVVKPMQNLMFEFIETMEQMVEFAPVETYNFRTFSRFGTESEKGILQNILDANLSGVALDIKISRYKENNCNC